MDQDNMRQAYRLASEMMKDLLRDADPETLQEMTALTAADIIVTRGEYDHIETVLQQLEIPFTLVAPREIDTARLRDDQCLFVNCPGVFTPEGLGVLQRFVERGGHLFTTDWALKNVLEPAFPGYVAYNQHPTRDDVVRVEVLDGDGPFLSRLLGPDDDPQWWLERASYPIQLLAPDRVRVLVTSQEIARRYGEAPVFISFDYGAGRVYHMISHFYLQRTEHRTRRQRRSSLFYLAEKGIDPAQHEKYRRMGADGLHVGEVESAYSSQSLLMLLFAEKHRRRQDRGKADHGE